MIHGDDIEGFRGVAVRQGHTGGGGDATDHPRNLKVKPNVTRVIRALSNHVNIYIYIHIHSACVCV